MGDHFIYYGIPLLEYLIVVMMIWEVGVEWLGQRKKEKRKN